ncbi:MAG TPA: circadian clock protein KaiC [Polyangiaceae bacterium]|nr:circadian clock protein KaiC [Polyangiaceae bacterium]
MARSRRRSPSTSASNPASNSVAKIPVVQKSPTGIDGFDEITNGGLPRGRPTLVCGGAGCGKTLFGMHFLVHGATRYNENGVFLAFEEREQDLIENVGSLGFDLNDLVGRKLLALDHIQVDPSEIEENGEYDLEGLFLRLELAIDSVGAKRVVIDTLETVFGGLKNQTILRSELRRLFQWLKDKGVSAIITAERGDGTLTRHGLEEYVSDCVVMLDHRVTEQISTRRIRVVKYRGTTHGTNEYPFLIDKSGISVVPITSAGLAHRVSNERVSTGVPKLDTMLSGGYYRGSTVLISGTAGSGKSSLCAHFADATCRAGERFLYISYEESAPQIERNMRSIGLELAKWREQGLLEIMALRSTSQGIEGHLALIHQRIRELKPSALVVDPIGTLSGAGTLQDSHLMSVRLIDLLKSEGITALLTNLTHGGEATESTAIAVSSIVDSWLLVKALEANGERNRAMYVLKSRGTAHSNQIREFVITAHGIDLVEPYVGPEGVLTGTARIVQEGREKEAARARVAEAQRLKRGLERKRLALEQQIAAMREAFQSEEDEIRTKLAAERESDAIADAGRARMGELRGSFRPGQAPVRAELEASELGGSDMELGADVAPGSQAVPGSRTAARSQGAPGSEAKLRKRQNGKLRHNKRATSRA